MKKYRIMTFDGGGIRGALSATLLKKLDERCPKLIENTDLFAGTSTGSFIALGLAYGLSPKELISLYSVRNCRFIFNPKYPELFRPKYNNKNLKKVLSKVFPQNLKLKDLKHKVLISSFRLIGEKDGSWGPKFYSNYEGSDTSNAYVIDVAMCSSAAPIYFPSYKKHIDGGVIANNPSLAAISIARDTKGGNQKLDNICLLSIGTGFNSEKIKTDTSKWGAFEWTLYLEPSYPLLSILLDGNMETDTYYSYQLLGNRYFRLNPKITHSISLDDYNKIPYLIYLSEKFNLNNTINWIENNWF
ncbi:patatin-like phospholipase family protein [Tepidibacter formicigenes]|jgi:patatin-like phospholipase/acyl hydrolase|uniref:Patatin-like phospholipase/acyl hydrolase n=1 Tax=Tepidibacter formicigenes DSM 15518 TaxID=1123349 RepID=A0A1M6QSH8_9FIRM|nr:patatin-like phospholipase family protein [Tepidibacter formicigenes]SHK23279.1 Patatin-like phospholipase/acyl hydrolase [Tepidibacter formicigenes DSM 15518]